MFKKTSLRFFAGMLLGSSAGVFLGVGFNSVAGSYAPIRDPMANMDSVLNHVIWGAFFGLVFGGLVALGRKPLVSAFVSGVAGVFSMYLSAAVLSPDPSVFHSRLALGGSMMVGAALICELALWAFERTQAKKAR